MPYRQEAAFGDVEQDSRLIGESKNMSKEKDSRMVEDSW